MKTVRLSLGKKLAFGFGILVILVAFLGIYNTINLKTLNDELVNLYDNHQHLHYK